MKKRFIVTSILMALLIMMSFVFIACDPDNPVITPEEEEKERGDQYKAYPWEVLASDQSARTKDSSDLVTWGGGNLSLSVWNANQTGDFPVYKATKDVVYPEIQRVTGVTIGSTFDNGGLTASEKLSIMYDTKTLPQLGYGTSEMAGIIDDRLVWDLTPYKAYMPTIMRRNHASVWNNPVVNGGISGKIYGVPFGSGNVGLSVVDKDMTDAQKAKARVLEHYNDYYSYVYVREDILMEVAKVRTGKVYTSAELDAMFNTPGFTGFSEDVLFDVGIKSLNDFEAFMYQVYNAIEANNFQGATKKKVTPMLAIDGSDRDNWSVMSTLWGRLMNVTGPLNTMFTYWDAEAQEVKMMCEQDFFKVFLKRWNGYVKEGKICNDKAFSIKSQTLMTTDLPNGDYAVLFENALAPGNMCVIDGKEIPYRKVYMKIEKPDNFEFFVEAAPQPASVVLFKDKVKKEDIPQILMWLDFQQSEVADKLVSWGPRSAGLWKEENGVRRFNDEAKGGLMDQMILNKERIKLGKDVQDYNLSNGLTESANVVFPLFWNGGSKDHPVATYDSPDATGWKSVYTSYEAVQKGKDGPGQKYEPFYIARRACIWKWTDTDFKYINAKYGTKFSVETYWARRPNVENALKQVMIGNVSAFEANYNSLLINGALRTQQWNDAYLKSVHFTEAFLKLNEDYIDPVTGKRKQ